LLSWLLLAALIGLSRNLKMIPMHNDFTHGVLVAVAGFCWIIAFVAIRFGFAFRERKEAARRAREEYDITTS
jgi:hypothetical protein